MDDMRNVPRYICFCWSGTNCHASSRLAPRMFFFRCPFWATPLGGLSLPDAPCSEKNTVTLNFTYILCFMFVCLLFGVIAPGFYIFGAFFASCSLACGVSFGCPIRVFNSAELEGSTLFFFSLIRPVDFSMLPCGNGLGFWMVFGFAFWQRLTLIHTCHVLIPIVNICLIIQRGDVYSYQEQVCTQFPISCCVAGYSIAADQIKCTVDEGSLLMNDRQMLRGCSIVAHVDHSVGSRSFACDVCHLHFHPFQRLNIKDMKSNSNVPVSVTPDLAS